MANISNTIQNAKLLGIKITNADLDTEICQAWAARVNLATRHFERCELIECQNMIHEANRYAI